MQRDLGAMESMCALGHERLAGAAQIVVVVRLRGPLTAAGVRRALAGLAARHPLLRARIERSAAGYRFTIAEPPPEPAFTEAEASGADWQIFEEREVAAAVDPSAPWRTLLLRDAGGGPHTLLLTLHHAIADGLGVVALVRQLLELCDADVRGAPAALDPRPLLPAAEDLMPEATGPAGQPAAGPAAAPSARPHARPATIDERRPCNVHRALAPERVAALHARARREQTTINAALAAAMLLAERRLGADAGPGAITTIVSLRGRCQPPVEGDAMGCYITSVRTVLAVAPETDLWALARGYREAFAGAFTLPRPAAVDLAAASARFDPAAIEGMTAYPQRLGLTNLGALPFGRELGAFTLEHLSFCTSRRAGFYVGFLHAVTLAGELQLCFSFTEPLLERRWAEAFADAVVELVDASA